MSALRSRSVVFLVPGRLDTRTGGYEYDRRIVTGLRERGWTVAIRELDDSFPEPSVSALGDVDAVLAAIPNDTIVMIDGLAGSAMPGAVERHASRLAIVPIVHALIASEVGIDAAAAARRAEGERRALSRARAIVVAGPALVEPLVQMGIDPQRIAIVRPGTDPAPLARGSGSDAALHPVMVATINPGKGHDVLFRALSTLRDRAWRLTCAGSLERYPDTALRLRALLGELELDTRVTLAGEMGPADIAALYDSADVFVLPTLSETHPLVIGEALARGLPIVSTRVGAIPDLVGSGDEAAGLLVAPGDAEVFATVLARVIDDGSLRARLAENARRKRDRLRTWEDAVQDLETLMVSWSNHELILGQAQDERRRIAR
jgi:glycosyltransferase involved in cell wall biosynthesis